MKKIFVTQSSMPSIEEYIEEIRSIWDTRFLTNMGEKHVALEAGLKEYLEVPYITLFTNGHSALELLIQAYEFPKGSEIITTPFTFASTTHAIVRNGLKPVFADVKEDDFTLDPEKIEALITDKTVAILPVHVYGNICDVERIQEIANEHHLKVIYDAAHVFGVKYKGVGIGNYGDASMFSFHATKVFHTIEGGAITCDNPELIERLKDLKNFGIINAEEVRDVGGNAKLNEFSAAMGLCNLRHVDEYIERRGKVFERYNKGLEGIPGIYHIPAQENVTPNYAYYPIFVDEKVYGHSRNELFEELAKHDIHARKYFYPLTTDFACYREEYDSKKTPIALKASHEVITLPIYDELQQNDIDRIVDIISSFQK